MTKAKTRLRIANASSAGVDSTWRGARVFTKRARGWDFARFDDLLVIDLSNCTRVSLPGAARLAIAADRAVRDGIPVSIVRPALGVRQSELRALRARELDGTDISTSIRDQLVARHQSDLFLTRIGFFDAVSMERENAATAVVSEPGDVQDFADLPPMLKALAGTLDTERAQAEAAFSDQLLVPAAFRLRWISVLDRKSVRAVLDELITVMSQGEAGLVAVDDARGIASTVLFEALDNVGMHAQRDGREVPALLGATFVTGEDRPAGFGRRLDLVLADSGMGLVDTLGPFYRPSLHDRFLPPEVRSWPEGAKTIVWAFHPLSSSRSNLDSEPPARGLSRTRQQATYHRGRLRVRAGTHEVAWNFAAEGPGGGLTHSLAPFWPGTVLELSLPLLQSSGALPTRTFATSPPTVIQLDGMQVGRQARERVAETLLHQAPGSAVLLVLPDISVGSDGGNAAATLLGELAALTTGRPTIALLPMVASSELFASFEALVEGVLALDIRSPAAPPDEPMLLMGADRATFWWWPDGVLRQALTALAADAGFPSPPHLLEEAADTQPVALLGVPRLGAWVREVSGVAVLTVSAKDIDSALERWFVTRLRDHILGEGRGVTPGDQLVGTLDAVGRYVDLPGVLDATGTTRLAGRIAGNGVRDRLTESIALLVALPDVPAAYLESMRAALDFDGRQVRLNPTRVGWRLAPAPEARPGKSVVVAGVRYTGETLRTVTEQLIRWGAPAQLVAIALDGNSESDEAIHALDSDVPVYSLSHLDIPNAIPSASELAARAITSQEESSYPIPPRDFADSLAAAGRGFSLVHIERESDRHLVGYYNMREVLADDNLRSQIVLTLIDTVSALSADVEHDGHIILFPEDDPLVAGAIARDLTDSIAGARLRPMPRQPLTKLDDRGGLWALRDVATFIDWGVVTARTARSALFRLVAAGAAKANFVAITSQLDEEEEGYLRATGTFHRRAVVTHAGQLPKLSDKEEQVPVAFECLTRITHTSYTRQTCPLCAALPELTTYARDAPLPILRAQAAQKVELLRARGREEALAHVQDLYGSGLSREERSVLIQLWHDLDISITEHGARWQLFDQLSTCTGERRERVATALCRIVSARHDLLHSPPLSYGRFREIVANLSSELLSAGPRGAGRLASPVRRQAIVALRSASKERFIEALPAIIRDNLGSPAVMGQALLSVYSILDRRYFHGTATTNRLYGALVACEEVLTAAQPDDVNEDLIQSVRFLKRMAHTLANRPDVEDSVHIAWQALRHEYGDQVALHHHAINKLGQIVRSLNDLVTRRAIGQGDIESRRRVLVVLEALWRDCADFLAYGVLPSLPTLRSVLGAVYYQEKIGDTGDWQRWSRLLQSNATEEDLEFSRLLAVLLEAPERFDEGARLELLSSAAWLARFFLPLRTVDKSVRSLRGRRALLFTWLEECPVSAERVRLELSNALVEAAQEVQLSLRPFAFDPDLEESEMVFCPIGLVREVAEAIGDNICVHTPAGAPVQLALQAEVAGDSVHFSVTCLGTAAGHPETRRESRAGGLNGLVRRLAPFDADLEWGARGIDAFTTQLTLKRLELIYGRP